MVTGQEGALSASHMVTGQEGLHTLRPTGQEGLHTLSAS